MRKKKKCIDLLRKIHLSYLDWSWILQVKEKNRIRHIYLLKLILSFNNSLKSAGIPFLILKKRHLLDLLTYVLWGQIVCEVQCFSDVRYRSISPTSNPRI